MESDKKKFAAQRKFKEASACQNQLKSLQIENENYTKYLEDYIQKKKQIEDEVNEKQVELDQI